MKQSIVVRSSKGPYHVEWVADLSEALSYTKPMSSWYLIDRKVAHLYAKQIELPPERVIEIDATEENKSYAAMERILVDLVERGIKKNHELVVIGGGILQDMGAFAATVLMRGVPWILIPTTLLAQADSCVGSKSSLNLGPFKNQLGTFNAPLKIYIAPSVLRTLDPKDVRSGVGEVVKIALVKGRAEFERVKRHLANGAIDSEQGLSDLVYESLCIKKEYVETDEFDAGIRNLLNYGHTFGHAFETVSEYRIPHGIAVAAGVDAATYFSMKMGFVDEAHFHEIRNCIQPLIEKDRREFSQLNVDELLKAMSKDKKNSTGNITFILTDGPGGMKKAPLTNKQEIRLLLESYLRGL